MLNLARLDSFRLAGLAALGLLSMATLPACQSAPASSTKPNAPVVTASGGTLPISPAQAAELDYGITWASPVGLVRGQSLRSVTVQGDTVLVVEGPESLISAYDLASGSRLWRAQVGSDAERLFKPWIVDDQVFVNSETRAFTLRLDNGERVVTSPLTDQVRSDGVLVGRYVIFGSINGKIFAYDVDANYAKWEYQLVTDIVAAPVTDGDVVFAADARGNYAMLNAQDGDLLWRNRTFGPVLASATMTPNLVVVPCVDRSVYALFKENGRDAWIYRADEAVDDAPLLFGSLVLQPVGNELFALNPVDGQAVWSRETEGRTAMLVTQGNDLLTREGVSLNRLDPRDGSAEVSSTTDLLFESLPLAGDGLLLVTPAGRMVRLDPIR